MRDGLVCLARGGGALDIGKVRGVGDRVDSNMRIKTRIRIRMG